MTVNGAGLAPHGKTVTVGAAAGDSGTTASAADSTGSDEATATDGGASPGVTLAGADGSIPLVARESATKLAVDPSDSEAELTGLAVEDDFGGRLYDAPLSGPDAVYVHREGAYTAEVRDADDAVGAVRVNPGDEARVAVDRPDTGTASLARYVATVAEETRDDVAAQLDDGDGDDADGGNGNENGNGGGSQGGDGGGAPGNSLRGLVQVLEAIAEGARRAAEQAESGNGAGADARIDAVAMRLARATERLEAARDGLAPGLANAAENRFAQLDRRAKQAKRSEKL